MHVLYLTKDLFFSSRVGSLARAAGVTIDVNPSLDARLAKEDTGLVIIDLGLPHLDIAAAVRQLREMARSLKVVAYGPHVEAAMLAAAREAGCDLVLSRSQFDQQIAAILSATSSPPTDAGPLEAS